MKLREFAKAHPIELLLIDRGALKELGDIEARQIVTLVDGERCV